MYEPAVYNFSIYQGASFDLTMTWRDEDESIFNLTGYTGILEIKDQIGGRLMATMSSALGHITFAATAPNIVVAMTALQTAALVFSARMHEVGVYNLDITSPGGSPVTTRLIYGSATLVPDV